MEKEEAIEIINRFMNYRSAYDREKGKRYNCDPLFIMREFIASETNPEQQLQSINVSIKRYPDSQEDAPCINVFIMRLINGKEEVLIFRNGAWLKELQRLISEYENENFSEIDDLGYTFGFEG